MARDMPSWMSLLPPRWRNEIDKDTARAIAVRLLLHAEGAEVAIEVCKHLAADVDHAVCLYLQGEFVGTFLFVFLSTTGTRTALAVGVAYTVASETAMPIEADADADNDAVSGCCCCHYLQRSCHHVVCTVMALPVVQATPWRRCQADT